MTSRIYATAQDFEYVRDKIEGLTEDLRQAVLVAYQRGAREWAILNYPMWREWLEANDDNARPEASK